MHILICDDDAAFGTRMAEYVADYFAARLIGSAIPLPSFSLTSIW